MRHALSFIFLRTRTNKCTHGDSCEIQANATYRHAAQLRTSSHAAILWTGHRVESRLHRRVVVVAVCKFARSTAPINRCPKFMRHRGQHSSRRLLVVPIVAVRIPWLPVYCTTCRGALRLRTGVRSRGPTSGQGGGARRCGAERLRAPVRL